ncbi:MAG: hypothetical protein JNL23_09200 [Chitinophagaceae bacterium]|nr:hypothetical protein [Chitinophagaceae bacterium]
MKKKYLVYRTIADDTPGKHKFLYLEKIQRHRFFYTEQVVKAKKFTLFQAILLSASRLSFVPIKIAKIYK